MLSMFYLLFLFFTFFKNTIVCFSQNVLMHQVQVILKLDLDYQEINEKEVK